MHYVCVILHHSGVALRFRERDIEQIISRPHLYFDSVSTDGTGYFQCHTISTASTTISL